MSLSKRSLNILTHDIQLSILAHFTKKSKMNEDPQAPTPSHLHILQLPWRLRFPFPPLLSTFPDLFAKSLTGHSIQEHWFVDFPWLQLAETGHRTAVAVAYKNRGLNVSDLSFFKNTQLPVRLLQSSNFLLANLATTSHI